jgi:hypothetical protein
MCWDCEYLEYIGMVFLLAATSGGLTIHCSLPKQPFPGAKDRAIVAKKAYNDEQRRLNKRNDLLPGQDWYCQEAFRAIAQALGRCIRHEADYGTVVLMDSRHCHDGSPGFSHSKLPKWMRHAVRTVSPGNMGRGHNPIVGGYQGLRREMSNFFARAPAHCDAILKTSTAKFAAAQKREKQVDGSHEFDSNTGSWTPNTGVAKQGKSPLPMGCCESDSSRVTQESPVPPSMLSGASATGTPHQVQVVTDNFVPWERSHSEVRDEELPP